ncbi:MAG: glycosyltransferase family 4 protein [Planctomycetaceae bacterium]|nr:glycosyltransferase family 4 protein [Planctomycetaceae bacterium]
MNVAHIITRLIVGGAQENTLLTVEDQHRDYGDRVSLITGPPLGPEGSLLERAQAGGFDIRVVPALRRSIHPLRDPAALRALTAELRDFRPDLVHTHSSKAGILGRAAAARLGLPAVHTIHGAAFHYGQHPLVYRAYVAAERWAVRHTAHFISVSDDMTSEYVRAGVAAQERFTTVYSGFDVEPYLHPAKTGAQVRAELGIGLDRFVVGKVARLFHLKGHEFVLAAAQQIVAAEPRTLFLFIGDGVLRSHYEQQIRDLGLSQHFRFTGLVPPQRIPELLQATDLVVHTSQWEGLARVLPQGLIAGKPVISYDVGGAREVVISGETGRLLPRDAVEPLAEAVIELAANPALRRQMGENGRARFTDQFRPQTMTRRIRAVYQQVLDRRMERG